MCFYENEIIFTIGFALISAQAECTYSKNMTIMPLGGKFTSLTGVALSLAYSASRICFNFQTENFLAWDRFSRI